MPHSKTKGERERDRQRWTTGEIEYNTKSPLKTAKDFHSWKRCLSCFKYISFFNIVWQDSKPDLCLNSLNHLLYVSYYESVWRSRTPQENHPCLQVGIAFKISIYGKLAVSFCKYTNHLIWYHPYVRDHWNTQELQSCSGSKFNWGYLL